MSKITPKRYIKREILGTLLYPLFFVMIVLIFYPILKMVGVEFDIKIYLLWSLFGLTTSLIVTYITYKLTFKGRK